MNNERFVNPYNFIKLPSKKANAYDDKQDLYGVIHYTLTTKTPLFIPNSSNEKAFEESKIEGHTSYDFYSYTDLNGKGNCEGKYYEPVIPGSEIRGVVRNVYETLTDSCMSQLNEDVHPVKRIGAAFRPGLLYIEDNGSLSLIPAVSLRIDDNFQTETKHNLKNGDPIWFYLKKLNAKVQPKIKSYSVKENNNYCGYILKWGMGCEKNYYHAYVDKEEDVITTVDKKEIKTAIESLVESYKKQTTVEESNKVKYDDYLFDFKEFLDDKRGSFFPINYSRVGKNFYYSPAIFSKEISKNSIKNLSGDFVPCTNNKDLCPACDLFGMIGKDGSKASRVRFSDLRVNSNLNNEEYYYADKLTLANLNGPKLGNVDFYLKQPNGASFWTYDYSIKDGNFILSRGEIRGRKYYWHHRPENLYFKKTDVTKMNKTVRPVKKDISFTGDLYFDGISKKQLEQLIWILNSDKEGLGLKLGMGKPLGLGSVTLKVDSVEERKISVQNDSINYEIEEPNDLFVSYEDAGLSKEVEKEFKKIAKLDAVSSDLRICYPTTKAPDDNGFEWFQANHGSAMPSTRDKMQILKPLPNILDRDVSLPRFEKPKDNGKNNGGKPKNGNRGRR